MLKIGKLYLLTEKCSFYKGEFAEALFCSAKAKKRTAFFDNVYLDAYCKTRKKVIFEEVKKTLPRGEIIMITDAQPLRNGVLYRCLYGDETFVFNGECEGSLVQAHPILD